MEGEIKICFVMTSCKRMGPVWQTLNIIKYLDKERFKAILITIYEESENSILSDFLPYVENHYVEKLRKKDILLGKTKRLKETLTEIRPDIVHSVGVFPNFAICRMRSFKHTFTLRNYVYEDFPAKFGKIQGFILAKIQLYAIKKTDKVITCSESLARAYEQRLHLKFDFIRNGVDVSHFDRLGSAEKETIRTKLGIPKNAFIFIYTGQFIERKNIPFLLENFTKEFKKNQNVYLLLVGGGTLLDELEKRFSSYDNIIFYGEKSDVTPYLQASDAYVSTSKSEGLPNGVLEAMAVGLPVVLSDIEQHKELFEINQKIGYLYHQKEGEDLRNMMKCISETGNMSQYAEAAYETAHNALSAEDMSMQYQDLYVNLARGGVFRA